MKTQTKKVVTLKNSKGATQTTKKVEFINITPYSKGLAKRLDKIDLYYRKANTTNWDNLLLTSICKFSATS